MKYLRIKAVNIKPKAVPPSAITRSCTREISAFGLRINIPGMVKATPPATIAPADIAVCVTFISLRFVLPRALRQTIENKATNIIGHGSELSFSAINIELQVIITEPIAPITIPLTVSCLPFILHSPKLIQIHVLQ